MSAKTGLSPLIAKIVVVRPQPLSLYFFTALFFNPEAKGAGEIAAAGKGGGMDGVIQFPAEWDPEMVLDMAAAAKAIGDR